MFLSEHLGNFFSPEYSRQSFLKTRSIKGNMQVLFLFNPQKLGASQVCITFPQITQKVN